MATLKAPSTASRASPFSPAPMAASNAPAGTFAPGTKVQVGGHRVMIQKYLSEGGFAHVYVVQVISPVARETAVLKRVAVPDKEELANMRTEVETMKKLKGHKHIVTYIDSHASQLKAGGYEVFLLMEYCAGGGLIDFMNTRLKNRLTEPEILKIFSDAAEGVACMHYLKPPLLHRDLKVENILISTTANSKLYKLCDFGSTAPPRPAATNAAEGKLIEDDVQRHTTLQYRSPEMIDVYRRRPIDEKTMMLTENPEKRPNVYQVVKETCTLRGVEVPIKDVSLDIHDAIKARSMQRLPPSEPDARASPIGAQIAAPERSVQTIPSVAPMRRGRPTGTSQSENRQRPSPSPGVKAGGDPFAALDSQNHTTRAAAVDELSGRFPALDDFSLLNKKKDSSFKFDATSPKDQRQTSTNQRMTEVLADEAFRTAESKVDTSSTKLPSETMKTAPATRSKPMDVPKITAVHVPPLQQPEPQRPKMVSTGTTMTDDRLPSTDVLKPPKPSDKPIWRVPSPSYKHRVSPLPIPRTDPSSAKRQTIADPTLSSFSYPDHTSPKSPASSRPSLEMLRAGGLDVPDSIHRSRSAHARSQDDSDRLSSRHALPPRPDDVSRQTSSSNHRHAPATSLLDSESALEDNNITSDVDFLRAKESEEALKHHHKRTSSLRHLKHTSMSGMSSLSGPKNILAGRFGDTFRRFEHNRHSPRNSMIGRSSDGDGTLISPIETDDVPELPVADDDDIDETEDLSPEVRRELERRRLSQEERRVNEAAAAYRQQVASGEPQRISRASAIQSRVKNLLDESGRQTPVTKTASGYGRFTLDQGVRDDALPPNESKTLSPSTNHQPLPAQNTTPVMSTSTAPPRTSSLPGQQESLPSRPLPSTQKALPPRPSAPPKPHALRTGGPNPPSLRPAHSVPEPMETPESPDPEIDFSKRYPDLSLEMVETEIEKAPVQRGLRATGMRIRDV
ncbi:MAG: hypothetical protein M1828_005913 [Chrysothrix sp. TS-e1954]|nr:MAG: hypothetical protein M1828_005913 [Chrysothrix sp. TS-e1954]